jgi:hypothetical protein
LFCRALLWQLSYSVPYLVACYVLAVELPALMLGEID